MGVGIAVFAINHTDFIASLPASVTGAPQFNLAVPAYMINALPLGLVGLALVALFAAAMSSLDSVLNSLSATTMEDFIIRFRSTPLSEKQEINLSRLVTTGWGILTLTMAFYVGDIAPTVLEAINKIGSLANGSILAVFTLALISKTIAGWAVCMGLLAGITVNALCWQFAPSVSWLWWNPLGFSVTVLVASTSLLRKVSVTGALAVPSSAAVLKQEAQSNWYLLSGLLAVWFIVLLVVLLYLNP